MLMLMLVLRAVIVFFFFFLLLLLHLQLWVQVEQRGAKEKSEAKARGDPHLRVTLVDVSQVSFLFWLAVGIGARRARSAVTHRHRKEEGVSEAVRDLGPYHGEGARRTATQSLTVGFGFGFGFSGWRRRADHCGGWCRLLFCRSPRAARAKPVVTVRRFHEQGGKRRRCHAGCRQGSWLRVCRWCRLSSRSCLLQRSLACPLSL
jgi:hypothetical protein